MTPPNAALTIAVIQTNPTLGAFDANVQALAQAATTAWQQGARVVCTADYALCGAPLYNLATRPAFIQAQTQAIEKLAVQLRDCTDLTMIVGNSQGLAVLHNGRCVLQHMRSQPQASSIDIHGMTLGLLTAEQLPHATITHNTQLLLVAHAQTFAGTLQTHTTPPNSLPCIHAHLVGAQDEWVFAGGSCALQNNGECVGQAAYFAADTLVFDVHTSPNIHLQARHHQAAQTHSDLHATWCALVLAIRDYVHKSGFSNVLLGLSGGIDSALVLALAVDALGSSHVQTVMMPTRYTAQISLDDAHHMAQGLGVQHTVIDIDPLFENTHATLSPHFADKAPDATEENLQARIRGMVLMALSNKHGALVLAAGNKSELAVGYCTLYGDMAGGYAPIKDVLKTQVFALARWRNTHNPLGTVAQPMPERIITRPPSAELRANQTDQDSLPDYATLDYIITAYIQQGQSIEHIAAHGIALETVQRVVRLLRINAYKSQQAPIGARISNYAYGSDWSMPMVNQFIEQ